MKSKLTTENTILVQLIVRDSCPICDKVQGFLEHYQPSHPKVKLQIFNLDHGDAIPEYSQCFVTPALWVNGSLWYLGGFDPPRFDEKVQKLENKIVVNSFQTAT
ncbi:MAG: hypothetical protein ACE5D2_05705 [Fidelibacterota bacterium]